MLGKIDMSFVGTTGGAIVSVIIPTKGRPEDLRKAVASILAQIRRPDELIIIDQSADDLSKAIVVKLIESVDDICLDYVLDPRIQGLVCAKKVGVERSKGDIICFLEDDIVLEPNYLNAMVQGFSDSRIMGCGGVITNPPKQSWLHQVLHRIFHIGLFHDPRPEMFRATTLEARKLIPSKMISGGVSAWRAEVFAHVHFDTETGFHMYEDIDFSLRVDKAYPDSLFINSNVRLEHFWSKVNRDALATAQRRKVRECFAFYRKHRSGFASTVAFVWLLIGFLLESVALSLRAYSCNPLTNYFNGIKESYF